VPPNAEHVTKFLNVDLDLHAESGVEELLRYLDPFVVVLARTTVEATVELNEEHASLEETVVGFIRLVQSLPPHVRRMWDDCQMRRLNIGIQADTQPYAAFFSLSSATVALLADIQAEIMWTVYAPLAKKTGGELDT
jgi:hypothetical protein